MNGRFQMQGRKTGFCRKRSMQTGSSGTLNGWKSGQTNFFLYGMGPNGGSVAMVSEHPRQEKTSCIGMISPTNHPRKDPFDFYSLSPHLSQFQQSTLSSLSGYLTPAVNNE